MIPEFNEHGYLPPGIHPATIKEIEERFGRESELRQVQMQSLYWLIDLARRVGVERIVINGSFITDVYESNDVDCALLLSDDYPREENAAKELTRGLPFLQIELADQADFDWMVTDMFASDRFTVPKGVVEIVKWN